MAKMGNWFSLFQAPPSSRSHTGESTSWGWLDELFGLKKMNARMGSRRADARYAWVQSMLNQGARATRL